MTFGETTRLGAQDAPLVVVLHDQFGRRPWLLDRAEALAREGLQVAVPDFLDGWTTDDAQTARERMEALRLPDVLAHLAAIIDEARLLGAPTVGVLGYSTGGWLGLVTAMTGGVDAVVAYYVSVSERHHRPLPCPVLLQYAEADGWEYAGDPVTFMDRLRKEGTPLTNHAYYGTRHHFANPDQPAWDRQAAELAHARATLFLTARLQGDGG